MLFKDRRDAGRQLSRLLLKYTDQPVIVYALPRGGVPVAAEIAHALHAPLELLFAHKIGHPHQPEVAIAAISESGYLVQPDLPFHSGHEEWIQKEAEHQIKEIERRRRLYLQGRKEHSITGKIAIIVDDGIATGLTMQAGILELKSHTPKKIVVAIPVAPKSTTAQLRMMVDELAGNEIDDDQFLGAVGAYYSQFDQVEDQEVTRLLHQQNLKS